MENRFNYKLQNNTARIAGLLYTLMIPLGAFGIMYIPRFLIVSGDADATIANILTNGGLFRLSMLSALVVQICHIFIVLLLYKLLKPVNGNMAALMVIFLLVSIPISIVNELSNYMALLMVNSGPSVAGTFAGQPKDMLLLFFELHKYGIFISGFFWGLWLFPMGYLVIKSHFLPKLLGILLIIAFCGYIVDSLLGLGFPGYGETAIASIMKLPMYCEVLFPLWLLFKGIKPSLDAAQ